MDSQAQRLTISRWLGELEKCCESKGLCLTSHKDVAQAQRQMGEDYIHHLGCRFAHVFIARCSSVCLLHLLRLFRQVVSRISDLDCFVTISCKINPASGLICYHLV
jgi:hypothetical protein